MARGLDVPLPDFPVTLPSAAALPDTFSLAADCLPEALANRPVDVAAPPPGDTLALPPPVTPQKEPDLESLSSESSDSSEDEEQGPPTMQKAGTSGSSAGPASASIPSAGFLWNARSNVVHIAMSTEPGATRSRKYLIDGSELWLRPLCGARTHQLDEDSFLPKLPSGAASCTRSSCFSRLPVPHDIPEEELSDHFRREAREAQAAAVTEPPPSVSPVAAPEDSVPEATSVCPLFWYGPVPPTASFWTHCFLSLGSLAFAIADPSDSAQVKLFVQTLLGFQEDDAQAHVSSDAACIRRLFMEAQFASPLRVATGATPMAPPPPSGSPSKIAAPDLLHLRKTFLAKYPGELLTPETTPSLDFLSLLKSHHDTSQPIWVPWRLRTCESDALRWEESRRPRNDRQLLRAFLDSDAEPATASVNLNMQGPPDPVLRRSLSLFATARWTLFTQ
ncbi:unnamed protein product [Symbiodinium sp. CCMP2456]|nr:unnamed protein product [Symbiodinium sp. CCMP2456]